MLVTADLKLSNRNIISIITEKQLQSFFCTHHKFLVLRDEAEPKEVQVRHKLIGAVFGEVSVLLSPGHQLQQVVVDVVQYGDGLW